MPPPKWMLGVGRVENILLKTSLVRSRGDLVIMWNVRYAANSRVLLLYKKFDKLGVCYAYLGRTELDIIKCCAFIALLAYLSASS